MFITKEFICNEIYNQTYEITLHADNERIADSLTISELEFILLNSNILEYYMDDPRGESCLLSGLTPDASPLHIVCGKNSFKHMTIITVYIPTMPKWIDPYTRNKGDEKKNGQI